MDSETPQQAVSKQESTSSTGNVNVSLEEDNISTVRNATEIIEKKYLRTPEAREQLLNKRAISKTSSTYELEKFNENLLIIFYHDNIKGFKPRIGDEKEILMNTFKKFGFKIKEHDNCKKDEIFRELKKYTHTENLSKYGCVAVAVITYGTDDRQLRAKDTSYSETEIYDRLVLNSNHTLITKPKLIIIEASRGEEVNSKNGVDCPGITVRDSDEMDYRLPRESDSLILYSHYARSPSKRLHMEPWFIRVLCEKINAYASELDLESIMTGVLKHANDSKDLNLPVVTSSLLRELFLRSSDDGPLPMQTFTDDKSRSELPNNSITLEPSLSFENMYCNFMKTCLKYYIEEKPDDEAAKELLQKANTSEDKLEISKLILDHLMRYAQHCQCFKFVSFRVE